MTFTYRTYDQQCIYYITCTVNQWNDVLTRKEYVDILLDSLRNCQKQKGLEILSWVVMTNHIHLIISTNKDKLSDIISDFKKLTSSKIITAITENPKESRKSRLLLLLKKENKLKFWQDGCHPEEVTSLNSFNVKQDYIHSNPVRAGLVEKEEEYLYSSCGQVYGVKQGLLELTNFV
jgi:putative transposase